MLFGSHVFKAKSLWEKHSDESAHKKEIKICNIHIYLYSCKNLATWPHVGNLLQWVHMWVSACVCV